MWGEPRLPLLGPDGAPPPTCCSAAASPASGTAPMRFGWIMPLDTGGPGLEVTVLTRPSSSDSTPPTPISTKWLLFSGSPGSSPSGRPLKKEMLRAMERWVREGEEGTLPKPAWEKNI